MGDPKLQAGGSASDSSLHPIVKARWGILLAFLALCVWLIPGVTQIQNDDDVLAFLPPDHPEVVNFHEVADRFGMMEVALVGLSANGEDLLTPQRVAQVRDLAIKTKELGGVKTALSFADLPNPVVTDDGLIVDALVPTSLTDPDAIREQVLGSRDAVGNLVSEDGEAAALLVFLLPRDGDGPEAFAARRQTLDDLRALVESDWDGEAYFAGAPYVEMAASSSSRTDIERLSPIVIGVLAIASALLLGSISAAFLNLLVTGLGVALIMGAHGRFEEALTIVSSSTPVMMVALGGAFGVHMLAGYQRHQGTSQERASKTVRELWKPVLMSGATTAVAFFALVVMPQVPMQRFGVVAGCSMLLLLVMALLVLPALLAVLPDGLLKHRPERPLPMPGQPPGWVLVLIAAVSLFLARGMSADPDTANVFDEDSEVRVANTFFDDNFGGSAFLQVTVEGDLNEAEVQRMIRDMSEELLAIEGVADVRSVFEPVQVLNAALGGRRGVPETTPRTRRVLTYLIGHPAMAQLMTEEADGALLHIKLAPMDGARQVEVTAAIREVVERNAPEGDRMRVASTSAPAVAEARDAKVGAALARLAETEVDVAALRSGKTKAPKALVAKVTALRDELDDPDEGIFAVDIPDAEMTAMTVDDLLSLRGEKLEQYMRDKLPTAVAEDPEGIAPAAKHLGQWIDEEKGKYEVEGWCATLGIEERCEELLPRLGELKDEEWRVAASVDVGDAEVREFDVRVRLTGQPVIGQAFAESVTTSLWQSTIVSILALSVVLLIARSLFALIPALWTLAFSAGIIALLGHPISVGTSMITCIALGAGVDFAIHLGFRARQYERGAGQRAVKELGAVVVISAVQLALAFSVLLFSEMPPLQQFGMGLSIGLIGAALGAVWFTPMLLRDPKGAGAKPSSGGDPDSSKAKADS